MKIYLAAIGIWFVFLVIAFSLATVREIAVQPLLGEPAAHVVGTVAVTAALLAVMVLFVRRARDHGSTAGFWLIGLLWSVMTASFEFLFFHFVAGKPWSELLADYNIAQGRIWILVLLTTLFGPPAINAIFRRRKRTTRANG